MKNGVGLEKWLDQTIESAGFNGHGRRLQPGRHRAQGRPGDEEMAAGDPHIWHNPQNAKIMVTNIEKALAAADPAAPATFAEEPDQLLGQAGQAGRRQRGGVRHAARR